MPILLPEEHAPQRKLPECKVVKQGRLGKTAIIDAPNVTLEQFLSIFSQNTANKKQKDQK